MLGPRNRQVMSVTKYAESSEKDGISEDKRHPGREAAGQQRRLTPFSRVNAMVDYCVIRSNIFLNPIFPIT
jgi:hypothetical protein